MTNPTDRNVTQTMGIWHGHITLPSSFVTLALIVICGSFLLVTYWCFQEVRAIRERLREHEKIIYDYIEKTPTPTPFPSYWPFPSPTPPPTTTTTTTTISAADATPTPFLRSSTPVRKR